MSNKSIINNSINSYEVKRMEQGKKFKVASLFAGAGGLDKGLDQSEGFETIYANDIDKDACQTFASWSDAEVVCGNIKKIDADDIPDVDIVTGGFPCQGFSAAGPRKVLDVRNELYKELSRVIEAKQPYAFIGENVKGLLTLGNGDIMNAIVEDFSSKGYNLYYQLLNAADYGVPQDRWRVILIGIRKDIDKGFTFPEPTGRRDLYDVIGNMPEPNPNDVCQAPYSPRYMSRNRKRNWDEVSYTIPAMAKQVTLHPSSPDMIKLDKDLWEFGEGVTRRFSWQEAAAIQTFPEGMEFVGDLVSKYKQIGNAVPPKLAEVIARELYSTLIDALKVSNKHTKVVV
ncbi:DNA cytosine methyltransferase [Mesobacillus subterraneus]|uniref:DNA cytosine methyltransferase n=1 Tax=Mesobacillus subterraneus TaxID=285983 RepID=UPI001CFF3127|nr:DNA cytosine methyltransferase [Mesobacillus subterraneus]WLR55939.1 DNA cytosine methyltransferase [Mesobacillus subterraneus]